MLRSISRSPLAVSTPFEKISLRKLLSTSAILAKDSNSSSPPNSSITPTNVHNRNPRNLEKLRIGEKPMGWNLDNPGAGYWNKVTLEVSNKHIEAKIVHFQGQVPVQASTHEWCIRKYLTSTKDFKAFEVVGKVLARRCLQTGLNEVQSFFTEEELAKDKIKVFVKALEDGGLTLQEPEQHLAAERVHLNYPVIHSKAWETFEEIDEKLISKMERKSE